MNDDAIRAVIIVGLPILLLWMAYDFKPARPMILGGAVSSGILYAGFPIIALLLMVVMVGWSIKRLADLF